MSNADGSIIISTNIDASEADKELRELTKDVEKIEKDINSREAAKSPLVEQAEELRLKIAEAKKEVQEYQAAWINGVSGADVKEMDANQKVQQLQAEQDKIIEKIDKIDAKLLPAYEKLDGMKTKAGELAQQIELANKSAVGFENNTSVANIQTAGLTQQTKNANKATAGIAYSASQAKNALRGASRSGSAMAGAMARAQKNAATFALRLKSVMRSALVFTVITKGLTEFREWIGKALKSNDEMAAAAARLKGALLTLAQPLRDVIIPAFSELVNILAVAVSGIARVTSSLFGKTIDQSAEAAKNLYDEQKALEGVNKAANKASKSIAGFDEMNIMSGDSGSSGGTDTTIAPDFTSIISGAVDPIIEFFSGTAMLALGAILTFSGAHILLGIGLMAAGAALMFDAASENWGAIEQALQGPIGEAFGLVGGAFLVLGAILAFSGANIPLGIGLMLLGAADLATVVSANWDSIKNALQGPIGAAVTLAGITLLVLGAILAFSGANIPLGIGLIVAGAAGIAATIVANWNSMNEALQGPIGAVVGIISGALLVLGIILLFTGAALPLGLGLLVAGAAGISASVAANWNTIVSALQGPIGAVVAIVSAALLVLGVILLFTGAGIPLGIGLIAAGAAGLAAAIAPNWNFILDKLKAAWVGIKKWWNTKIVPAFNAVKEFFVGIFNGIWGAIKTVINTILGGIEGMTNGIIKGINFAINAVNKLSFDVPDWVPVIGGKSVGFNLKNISEVKIPRLAQGAVIPPNREFLAVLGDQKSGRNIEAPEGLIRQVMAEEISKLQTGPVHITVKVGDAKLAELVINSLGDYARQHGSLPIPI